MSHQSLAISESASPAAEISVAMPTSTLPRPLVLVVEHDPVVANVIATLLDNSGYTSILATDGLAALCQVRSGSVDLVLLDRDLPGIAALDLCREIWTVARGAPVHLPILMLTPTARLEDICAAYAAGADDYVPRPFHPAELLARLRGWLQVRALGFAAVDRPAPLPASSTFVDESVARAQANGAILPARVAPPVPDREAMWPDLTEPLTPREAEVLTLLASRLSNKEIAEVLCVSWHTVAKHANNIYQKLRVASRREAVNRAEMLGILSVGRHLDLGA
jgi:DNA-binding NarL/FixJ family response regulator